MHTITTRIQKRGRGSGAFTMMASGIAAAILFVVAIAVVGFDAASKNQDLSAQDGAIMQNVGNGVSTTAGR